MSTPDDQRTLVHHRAALGDTVLLWPLLRALAAQRASARGVALVSDAAKARLASRFLEIEAIDAESPLIRDLWREQTPSPGPRYKRVIWFGPPGEPDGGAQLERNLRAAFGASDVRLVHDQPDRTTADKLIAALGLTPVPVVRRRSAAGPVVLHVGAGSEAKRWAMERWCELHAALVRTGRMVSVVAGEVEFERLSSDDRQRFSAMGGRFVGTLDELADLLAAASVVVACDTGPGHLAAQLGVPTVSLFGPTDPGRWAPVGPSVRVIAPESLRGMNWLAAESVLRVELGEWAL